MLKGYAIPYSLDRNVNGGRLLLYNCEDIPSKFLKVKSDYNIKFICVEVNKLKEKELVCKWLIKS